MVRMRKDFETYALEKFHRKFFLEMLDILNEQLINEGKEPVVFDHDCREGICGMCSLYINVPTWPDTGITTCQLHASLQRWRYHHCGTMALRGFPIIKDLMVDRTAFDKIIQAGGYISVNTGGIPDANAIPILAMMPRCHGRCRLHRLRCLCGCLQERIGHAFVSAKVSQFALLPQGRVEAARRAKSMVAKMDELGFGNCTNTGACEVECPKNISISNIARLNREFLKAKFRD